MNYIVSLLLIVSITCAKDFSIVINKPFNSALFDITQDYDRAISAVGISENFTQKNNTKSSYTNAFDYLSSLSQSHSKKMHLIKIDQKANLLIDKAINIPNFNRVHSLVKTQENGYFIGGDTKDGSLFVAKISSNGSTVFSKKFGTTNTNSMAKLVALRDGGVLVVGSSTTTRSQNDSLFETGLGLSDIYLVKFNLYGEKVWSKKFGTQYDDKGVDGVESNDGSLMILSTTEYEDNKQITLLRITENGNKVWLHNYKEKDRLKPYKIIKLRDNNFLISLTHINELNKEQVRLIKFNIHNNIIFDKEVYTSYSSALKDIKEYTDGSFIGVGYVKDEYNTDALAMHLDSKLSMTHQEHFGGENYDQFNAVTILHNSQVAIAGTNTHQDSQESNMWVVKLNRDMSLAQVSTKIENNLLHLKKIFKDELHKKELVLKDNLSLELSGDKLLFEVGKSELTKYQKSFLDTFCKKIIPFLKQNKEFISSLQVNGHTSSEWAKNDFTNSYLNNEKLSMNRAYSVLSYIFMQQNKQTKKWLSKVLKGSGLGFSKKIVYDQIEYKNKSRRVSIKIVLKK